VESTCQGWQDFDLEAADSLKLQEHDGANLPTR
jgi:hypothetical protein